MKQRITALLHGLSCAVCNPFSLRRRRIYADNAQAGGDMAYFRNLITADKATQLRRLTELRITLAGNGATPWEADLLVNLVDQYRQGRRNLIAVMPPQDSGPTEQQIIADLAFYDRYKGGPYRDGYRADMTAQDEWNGLGLSPAVAAAGLRMLDEIEAKFDRDDQ